MLISNSSVLKYLIILFLVFSGLYFASPFLIPLAIAGVMATLFLPFCDWLEKNKIPRGIAAFGAVLVIIILLVSITILISWQINELTKSSPLIKERILGLIVEVQQFLLNHFNISIERQSQIVMTERPLLTKLIEKIASSVTGIITFSALILVYILFLLYYRQHLKNFILKLFPQSQKSEIDKIVLSITHVSQQYLLGLSKMIVCLWLMYWIGFSALGLKNALFFALVCGLLEIVPYVGNFTGTSLTVLVAAAQGSSSTTLIGIVLVYGIIQFIQGWILEPFIVGSQVKLNPLFTIIALVLGDLVWGIPGIFLAIPMLAMFKVVCDHFESLKPIGFLIGETQKKESVNLAVLKIKSLLKKKN